MNAAARLVAVGMLGSCGALAQDTNTPDSFATDFEPASGYAPGFLVPDPIFPFTGNQPFAGIDPPAWEDKWLQAFNPASLTISNALAHSGTQSLEFTGVPGGGIDVISQAQHMGMKNGAVGSPVIWEEAFSIYIPSNLSDARAMRIEPSNGWPGQDFLYQIGFYMVGADGWRPELNIVGGVNDLRDEMGMAAGETFDTDKWWNVSIIADGANTQVLSVSISDDFGASFDALGLNSPFSLNGIARFGDRPERLNYFGADDVFIDDVSVFVVPEPATIAMLLAGAALLRRRR